MSKRNEAIEVIISEGVKMGELYGDSVYNWIHIGAPHQSKKQTVKQFNEKRARAAAKAFLSDKPSRQGVSTGKGEEGFSLIELAVSCAIMAILMASGFSVLGPLVEKFETQAEQMELQQQNQAAEIEFLIDSIN